MSNVVKMDATGHIRHMRAATKNRAVRIYLSEENDQILRSIRVAMPDLEETEIIRIIVSTSLRAIRENDFQLTFPLSFKIEKPKGK